MIIKKVMLLLVLITVFTVNPSYSETENFEDEILDEVDCQSSYDNSFSGSSFLYQQLQFHAANSEAIMFFYLQLEEVLAWLKKYDIVKKSFNPYLINLSLKYNELLYDTYYKRKKVRKNERRINEAKEVFQRKKINPDSVSSLAVEKQKLANKIDELKEIIAEKNPTKLSSARNILDFQRDLSYLEEQPGVVKARETILKEARKNLEKAEEAFAKASGKRKRPRRIKFAFAYLIGIDVFFRYKDMFYNDKNPGLSKVIETGLIWAYDALIDERDCEYFKGEKQ